MDKAYVKVYKLWHGNNTLLFGGRVILGYIIYSPNYIHAIGSLFLIISSEVILLSTVSKNDHISLTLFSLLFTILTSTFLIILSSSNPGYIPKQEFPFARGPSESPILLTALINEPSKQSAIERVAFEQVYNSSIIRLKSCRTCWIVRPPKTSHCSLCNLCVEGFDHHCPWVGTCIGKRNYKLFLLFIFSLFVLIAINLTICVLELAKGIKNDTESAEEFLESTGAAVFFSMYMSGAGFFVGGLSSFHIYLLFTGYTTNEALKKKIYYPKHNPFAPVSIWSNVIYVFCAKKFSFFSLTASVSMSSKDLCNICPSESAIKISLSNSMDFEKTFNEIKSKDSNNACIKPTDEYIN